MCCWFFGFPNAGSLRKIAAHALARFCYRSEAAVLSTDADEFKVRTLLTQLRSRSLSQFSARLGAYCGYDGPCFNVMLHWHSVLAVNSSSSISSEAFLSLEVVESSGAHSLDSSLSNWFEYGEIANKVWDGLSSSLSWPGTLFKTSSPTLQLVLHH